MAHRGKVKFFDAIKGFGFISADCGGIGDAFVGRRALEDNSITELRDGAEVEFEFEPQADGRNRVTSLKLFAPSAWVK